VPLRFSGEVEESSVREKFVEAGKISVAINGDFRPVVQAGSAHSAIVETESGNAYNVQRNLSSRAQSGHTASVGRNLRLYKRHVDHELEFSKRVDLGEWRMMRGLSIKSKGTTNFVEVFVVPLRRL
jgi:hypothetical protein